MRLLIDEMYPATIGEQLVKLGHDVKCISAEPDLRALADPGVFAVAQTEGRAIVTENVGDFTRLVDDMDRRAKVHFGVIFIHPAAYPRGLQRSLGRITKALDAILREHPGNEPEGKRLWL